MQAPSPGHSVSVVLCQLVFAFARSIGVRGPAVHCHYKQTLFENVLLQTNRFTAVETLSFILGTAFFFVCGCTTYNT